MSADAYTDLDGSVPGRPDARFWDCSVTSCPRAAAIDIGGCERRSQHYCVGHVGSTLHPCSVSIAPPVVTCILQLTIDAPT